MKVIRDKVEGSIVLSEDTQLHGMIVGSVMVPKDTVLQLHGMIIGSLTLREESTVYLHGMVMGDVINEGGHLEVFGMVNGKVIRKSGKTMVDSKAIVRDGIL